MPDEASSKLYRELTAAELEKLAKLRKHPGWPLYLARLRISRVQALQEYLDTKSERMLGQYEGFKRAEKLLDWMLDFEPKLEKPLKRGDPIPEFPDESLSMEDLVALDKLTEGKDV